jgi:hypothetical protein
MSTDTLTIVTACDERYARCADQFLRSARRHGLHQGPHRFVGYDIGMTAETRVGLQQRYPWCEWRDFDFAPHPPHVRLAHHNYAWKPLVLEAAVALGAPLLLWLDSATLLHTGDLSHVVKRLHRELTYTLRGQKTLMEGCDRRVLDRMQLPKEQWLQPIHVSGVVGINTARAEGKALLQGWADAARDPLCNFPPGPRHSADQSLLSIVLYGAVHRDALVLNDEEIDISSRQPVRWLSSRNKVKPFMPRSADVLSRAYWSAYKYFDRLGHHARHLYRTRVMGWNRSRHEHYAIALRRKDTGEQRAVPPPEHGYDADPFVWTHDDGARWLFAERFEYHTCRGHIVVMPVDEQMNVGSAQVALRLPTHCSFPFLLRHQDTTYLVPETSAQRTVDLYEATDFPRAWHLKRRLLCDIDAADSAVFHHNGRWWLLTSVRASDKEQRALAIFHADDLTSSEWTPHPVNAEQRYADRLHGYGRNAGSVRVINGQLVRYMQSSTRYYGESVQAMRINTLTTTGFSEELLLQWPHAHHVSEDDGLVAWDTRDRV